MKSIIDSLSGALDQSKTVLRYKFMTLSHEKIIYHIYEILDFSMHVRTYVIKQEDIFKQKCH